MVSGFERVQDSSNPLATEARVEWSVGLKECQGQQQLTGCRVKEDLSVGLRVPETAQTYKLQSQGQLGQCLKGCQRQLQHTCCKAKGRQGQQALNGARKSSNSPTAKPKVTWSMGLQEFQGQQQLTSCRAKDDLVSGLKNVLETAATHMLQSHKQAG